MGQEGRNLLLAAMWRSRASTDKAMPDHVHMLLSVPPKYSIAMTIGYLKGKSAIRIHRELLRTRRALFGRTFWARGIA